MRDAQGVGATKPRHLPWTRASFSIRSDSQLHVRNLTPPGGRIPEVQHSLPFVKRTVRKLFVTTGKLSFEERPVSVSDLYSVQDQG